jgi:hypothetical protein
VRADLGKTIQTVDALRLPDDGHGSAKLFDGIRGATVGARPVGVVREIEPRCKLPQLAGHPVVLRGSVRLHRMRPRDSHGRADPGTGSAEPASALVGGGRMPD